MEKKLCDFILLRNSLLNSLRVQEGQLLREAGWQKREILWLTPSLYLNFLFRDDKMDFSYVLSEWKFILGCKHIYWYFTSLQFFFLCFILRGWWTKLRGTIKIVTKFLYVDLFSKERYLIHMFYKNTLEYQNLFTPTSIYKRCVCMDLPALYCNFLVWNK